MQKNLEFNLFLNIFFAYNNSFELYLCDYIDKYRKQRHRQYYPKDAFKLSIFIVANLGGKMQNKKWFERKLRSA